MNKLDKAKVNLIREINQLLIGNHQNQISPEDFNILWDMDIDEIEESRLEILKQIRMLKKYEKIQN